MRKHPKVFVKPHPKNPMLRDPVTFQFLDAKGEWKPRNSYWVRKIKYGDVVVAEVPKAAKKGS